MKTRSQKILNICYICFGLAMLLVVIIGFSVTYVKDKQENDFHMTKQQFIELANSDDDDALVESAYFWTENKCPMDKPLGKLKYAFASAPVKNVQAVMHLDFEVLEGGFEQFYYNGYHKYGFNYAAAFRAIKLDNVADLYLNAQSCFKDIESTMPDNDLDLSAFSQWYENNPLEKFDEEYSDCQLDVFNALAEYIRSNISYFGD